MESIKKAVVAIPHFTCKILVLLMMAALAYVSVAGWKGIFPKEIAIIITATAAILGAYLWHIVIIHKRNTGRIHNGATMSLIFICLFMIIFKPFPIVKSQFITLSTNSKMTRSVFLVLPIPVISVLSPIFRSVAF